MIAYGALWYLYKEISTFIEHQLQFFNDCLQSKIAVGHHMPPASLLVVSHSASIMTGEGSRVQAQGCSPPCARLLAAMARNASSTEADEVSAYARYVTWVAARRTNWR